MFSSTSQSRPHFGCTFIPPHFCFLFLLWVAISHMVQQCAHQNRGLGGKRLKLKGCYSVNMLRKKRRRRALAWPASRCDLVGLGGLEAGWALAVSGCRDGRGFGRVKYCWKGSCWWSAELQQLPLKTNGRNKGDREKGLAGWGGWGSGGSRVGSSLVGSSLFFFFSFFCFLALICSEKERGSAWPKPMGPPRVPPLSNFTPAS